MIISVSRRCDIPRFRFDWFLERLDAGFVDVANPFNAAQVRHVSLLPQDVEALVFWTRDPRAILEQAGELRQRGYRFYTMVTVTGYPALLEPQAPPVAGVINAMTALAAKTSPAELIWRYDPVFLSSLTDADFHVRNFRALAQKLKTTVRRVIISVYDEYAGAKRRIAALEREGADASGAFRLLPHYDAEGRLPPGVRALLKELAGIAADAGLEIQACAEAEDLSETGVKAGACIDGDLLGGAACHKRDTRQRPHCRCAAAVDIGSYGPCPAGCIYCYARR
jgi:hypothetical protein